MRSFLRSWRVLVLAWAAALVPQVTFVHALSHLAPQASRADSAGAQAEERQQATDKACDVCLALAQIGSALATHHEWQAPARAQGLAPAFAAQTVLLPAARHFLARAPPAGLS